jgi:HK97 family phage prohead protease
MPPERAVRDNIVRALYIAGKPDSPVRGLEMRAASEGGMPTMFGHFAVFDTWTEVDSVWEGRFMERIAPGAFKKTFRENKAGIRVLFQHGMDFSIGDKPIASIASLSEDDIGAAYEAPLIDARYVRDDILPGLEANVYGASFRFSVMREEWIDEPKVSDLNPKALPERTIKEVDLAEFGPVTFPQYPEATAGVRSLTDAFIVDRFRSKPDLLRELIAAHGPAPSADAGPTPTSPERRDDPPVDAGDPPHLDAPSATASQARPLAVPIPRLIRSDADWADFLETIR